MPFPSSISDQQSVSNVQNRKRPNPYDTTQDSPPAKRIKSTSAVRIASNFPPKFWDKLSKVWLTPRALREKDRRNGAWPPATRCSASSTTTSTTLARFARRGGPDLRHLRGYPEPKHAARMSSNASSARSSRRAQSTTATTVSSRAKRSSAYDKDFEQNLIDHGIYPEGFEHTDGRSTPEPENSDDIVRDLSQPRASLSPSQFSASAFKSFKLANSRVISEGKVMADILPIIRGNTDILNEGNLPFTNLDSITDGTTVDAVPDLYDGSHLKELHKTVRQDLSKLVIPTSHGRAPVVPNFFIEAKAPRGGADVAKRQACLDGAVGSRAMHSLQNYGENKPVYDGNSRTFSSTYHAGTGTLQLYAHHVTGPTVDGEQPEYHMTQMRTFGMTDTRETFIVGATAFRNARDLAQQQRQTFIRAANARASQLKLVGTSESSAGLRKHDDTHVTTQCPEETAWQDDDLQKHIAEACVEGCEDGGDTPTAPQYLSALDESQDHGQDSGTDDPLVSFVSNSRTSGTVMNRPKRARESFSSPTQGSRSSKSRPPPTTGRSSVSPHAKDQSGVI
ncbi:hypothetical protein NHJ13051_008429 [Beauveria bassiana]